MDKSGFYPTDYTHSQTFIIDGDKYELTNSYTKWIEELYLGSSEPYNFFEGYMIGWINKDNFPIWCAFSKYSVEQEGLEAKTFKFTSDYTPYNAPIYRWGLRGRNSFTVQPLRFKNGRWEQLNKNYVAETYRLVNGCETMKFGYSVLNSPYITYIVWRDNDTASDYHFFVRNGLIGTSISSLADVTNLLLGFFSGTQNFPCCYAGNGTTANPYVTYDVGLEEFDENGIATFTVDDITYHMCFTSAQWMSSPFTQYLAGDQMGYYLSVLYYDSAHVGKPQINVGNPPQNYLSANNLLINLSNNQITSLNTTYNFDGYIAGGYNCEFSLDDIQYQRTWVNGNCVITVTNSTLTQARVCLILRPQAIACWIGTYNHINTRAANVQYNGEETWYPIYSNEGEITGKFLRGDEPLLQLKLQPWQLNDIADNPWTEADVPVGPTPPSDDGEDDTRKRNNATNVPNFDGIRLVSGTGFCSFYLLSMYHVAELGQILSTMPQEFWESLGTATDYKSSNLLDYIEALKWYPLDIHATAPSNFPDTQVTDMQFGFNGVSKVTFTAPGTSYKLGTVNRILNLDSVYIPYRTSQQSFLDVEPYTDVYANLPYIGKVQLQANQVLGYTISCRYVVDLVTGIATCFLDNGFDTLYTGSGKIGVDISVSGNDIITQSERMATAYVGTATHAISNALSLGGTVSDGNPADAVVGTANLISGLVADSIATANAKRGIPQVVGGGSGFGSTYANQYPAIIVQRPAVKIPAGYGHSIGYVYNVSAYINMLRGFTVCANADLSGIAATSAELDMIKNILTTGFYA